MQEEELCNIAFPCIYRLTLAGISSENFTTHEECWLILTGLPHCGWTLSPPTGLSAVRYQLHLPLSVARRQLPYLSPFVQFLSRSLTHFRSRRDLESKPFIWFRTKTDKGNVCLADHLHSVTPFQLATFEQSTQKIKNFGSSELIFSTKKKFSLRHEKYMNIIFFVSVTWTKILPRDKYGWLAIFLKIWLMILCSIWNFKERISKVDNSNILRIYIYISSKDGWKVRDLYTEDNKKNEETVTIDVVLKSVCKFFLLY